MEIVLKNHEQMLFALLRASLHEKEIDDVQPFLKAAPADWKLCYNLAAGQGVLALAWDSVSKVPEGAGPDRMLRLKWGLSVDGLETKYERYCRTIAELSTFYAERGIVTMQMKGVGFSTHYPIPAHREGGDIDIFTYSADSQKMTDKEANRLADTLMQQQGIEVDTDHSPKHSNFYYKGIPIENHKTFLNVELYEVANQVENLLKKVMDPRPTELLSGKYTILTPSPAFNTLFLAFHAAQHYGSGLALHHLCDWAMLITRHGVQLPDALTDKRFREGIAAFTCLCNSLLGTSVPVEGGEDLAKEILGETLYPPFDSKGTPVQGKVGVFIYKTKRFLHRSKISNRILYKPLWKRTWDSIVIHIRRPDTIFQTNP